MKQKIEWYKEVLELEPGSRVFFPLAKLLAADGQTAEASAALRQGLLRHPDHIEARLLLVELLHLQHADKELEGQIDCLGRVFAAYPGFWNAWGENLAATPALNDAATAMRFFAAALQGRNISWGDIIEQGLSAVLRDDQGPGPAGIHPEKAVRRPLVVAEPCVQAMPDDKEREDAEEEDGEEAFSLRTRSMAEVLAEQGDLSGALDIYQELMKNADSEEKTSLEARVDELTQRMNGSDEQSPPEDKTPAHGGESTRLVSLLESLAQRLEARTR
ncbi:MAG: tetratricopeptide repeat-containing protein [Desulfovibrio sp.]|jgi:tetratricopeptide (TPR) repeat protein|nr:tetratricopeptide repeat-containing protein [Desulfovibrio sp.]